MSQSDTAVAGGSTPLPEGSLAQLAEHHGLKRAIARPAIGPYLHQLWERRHFIRTYATSRNISKYSDSMLGQLWQVLTPLLNAAIYFVMFGIILGTQGDVDNFAAFLITGMFVFTYTQRSVMGGSRAIASNLSLIRALHFPRAALPLAYTLQEFQQLIVSMAVLMVIIPITGETPTFYWLLVPVALALQTLFNMGAGLAMARVGATLRDVSQLLPFIMRTWLYASGVFFSIPSRLKQAHAPEWVSWILEFNPATVFIDLMRGLLITSYRVPKPGYGPPPDMTRIWLFALFWAVFALVVGFWYFWRAEERYGRG
ncbi:ABC transporter permease [Rhizohabitans arisaemae]|uniref:ABC transporter permease n=1 Tax=Rhizohabitans arisaemae TaxID=2720610 RepID=UPI0024B127A0|nr:ABC transporter permease [Rhizohabitans arisaemae]